MRAVLKEWLLGSFTPILFAWFRQVPEGTAPERQAYREQFGAGGVAEMIWHDPSFTLGGEYGIRIALAKVFAITPEEV